MLSARDALASIAYLALDAQGRMDQRRGPSLHDISLAVVRSADALGICGDSDTPEAEIGAVSDIIARHSRAMRRASVDWKLGVPAQPASQRRTSGVDVTHAFVPRVVASRARTHAK